MPIPSVMADLATTESGNSPPGPETIGTNLDNYLRAQATILRSTNALAAASIPSASTVLIGGASGESVAITGAVTINSFGTIASGIVRECRFTSTPTIVHSSAIQLPSAQNITVAAGDVLTFRSLGSGNWIMTAYNRPRLDGLGSGSFLRKDIADTIDAGNVASPFGILRSSPGTNQVSMRFETQGINTRFFGMLNAQPYWSTSADLLTDGFQIWHAGNDGPGSGLDADLLDGLGSGAFVQTSRTLTAGNGLTGGGDLSANRTFTMGTPTTLTPSTANAVTATSHTHAVTGFPELAVANTFTQNQTISNGTDSRLDLHVSGASFGGLRADNSIGTVLYAQGNTIVLRPNGAASALNGAIYNTSGNFVIAGTGTGTNWAVTSDARLKENIQPFTPRDLSIHLTTYDWKTGGSGLSPIAQDVQKIAPEYVHEAEDGTLALDKAGLALELVLALMKRVDVITYRVDRLVSLMGD